MRCRRRNVLVHKQVLVVELLHGHKVKDALKKNWHQVSERFSQCLTSLCATVTSTVDQIWSHIRLRIFGYSVTKWRTLHRALIKFLQEISDIIRYTFLTSLGRGCVALWNNKPVIWKAMRPCQTKLPHAKSSTTMYLLRRRLWVQIVQCLQRRRGRNWAIIPYVWRENPFSPETKGITSDLFRQTALSAVLRCS